MQMICAGLMLLLAALLFTYIGATYQAVVKYARDHVSLLLYATTGVSLLIILTGALVRGSGATLACIDWPACNGELFPFNQGPLQTVHMTHRFAVLAFGVLLVLLVWYAYQSQRPTAVKRLTVAALVLYLLQSVVGAFFVLTAAAPLWGTLHVGLASLTWSALAVCSVIEAAHTGSLNFSVKNEAQWKQSSAPTPR